MSTVVPTVADDGRYPVIEAASADAGGIATDRTTAVVPTTAATRASIETPFPPPVRRRAVTRVPGRALSARDSGLRRFALPPAVGLRAAVRLVGGELAAGRVDLATPRVAHGRRDAC